MWERNFYKYEVRFTIEKRLEYDRRDEREYVTYIKGELRYSADPDLDIMEDGEVVGRISAVHLNLGRCLEDDHGGVFYDLDAESTELAALGLFLFKDIGDIEFGQWADAYEDGCNGYQNNILFVDRVELELEHRGKGVGLMLMWRIIQTFGTECAFVITHPHPFDLGQSAVEIDQGIAKLRNHWRRLGFRGVKGTPYMVMPMAYKQPDIFVEESAELTEGKDLAELE